ncbi:MAG: hypothetical protein P8K79_07250 [Mariniblastus sp.]|nr:hypothetical protein [Mariniblastus sp.]
MVRVKRGKRLVAQSVALKVADSTHSGIATRVPMREALITSVKAKYIPEDSPR